MTGHEMLSELLLALQKYLNITDDDFDSKLMVDEDLITSIAQLRTHHINPILDSFLNSISNLVDEDRNGFLSNSYPNSGSLHIIDFTVSNLEKKNRNFAYSDPQFAFFSSKALFDSGNLIDFSLPENGLIWKQMETFFERNFNPDQHKINIFFDCLTNVDRTKGFLIKHIPDAYAEERHYAYIYLSFLNNSESLTLPNDLVYNTPNLHPTFSFIAAAEFEQYFDIYDVLNELNQAPDLLTRFLKLYHVLEYYMYRVYLVDLVTQVGQNKFFVREFINSAERMQKGEKTSFLKNYSEIFNADTATIHASLGPAVNAAVVTFLGAHKIVKNFSSNNTDKLAELIYGLRCAIVHNKESEYHLTVSLYDEFLPIIPLMRSLTTVLEELVIDKILVNNPKIKYSQRQVTLY